MIGSTSDADVDDDDNTNVVDDDSAGGFAKSRALLSTIVPYGIVADKDNDAFDDIMSRAVRGITSAEIVYARGGADTPERDE